MPRALHRPQRSWNVKSTPVVPGAGKPCSEGMSQEPEEGLAKARRGLRSQVIHLPGRCSQEQRVLPQARPSSQVCAGCWAQSAVPVLG